MRATEVSVIVRGNGDVYRVAFYEEGGCCIYRRFGLEDWYIPVWTDDSERDSVMTEAQAAIGGLRPSFSRGGVR